MSEKIRKLRYYNRLRGITWTNKSIADYELISKISEGGMGEIYRARDRKLETRFLEPV